jgi:eukaryotic-like serine/threonine-protein kinase
MADPRTCPKCGSAVPIRSPESLCPRCLLVAGLSNGSGSSRSQDNPETVSHAAPARSVLETIGATIGAVPHVILRDTAIGEEPSPIVHPLKVTEPTLRYRIDGEIARGGMGTILKGRDPDLGRDVAIKVLREDLRDNDDLVRRFVEEAQIGGQLQHPGVVPIYELGTFADQRPFFSMKLVKGQTLADLLAARPSPSEELPRFLSIFEAICQTMAYSHTRGVIHRDLKPSNVMVGSFGEVQVMDWGLAKVLARGGVVDDAKAGRAKPPETLIATARSGSDLELSHAGSILGTPSYMSPEQARGEIDRMVERADVFALGSILCELLTGQPAFVGRTSGEILRKAALGDLADAFARLAASGADADLIALARDCLAREPEDRPRAALSVADRVTAYLAGVQEKLRQAELESVEERARRRLTTVAAVAVILLTLAGGGGYVWNQRQRAERVGKTARAVDDALADAARLRGEAQAAPPGEMTRWSEALSAAKRAEGLLAQGEADAPLRGRVAQLMAQLIGERDVAAEKARQLEADRVLLAELETARGNRADQVDPKRTDADYAAAFRRAGLDLDKPEPEQAGRWLLARSEPVELAIFLDDWAFVRRDDDRPRADWWRLLAAARAADPDPWRNALRDRVGSGDEAAPELRRLADDEKALNLQAAPSLCLLASNLKFGIGDAKRTERVMRRAVARFPADFWARVQLAFAYETGNVEPGEVSSTPDEPVRHMTAAVAIRPRSPMAHLFLGDALKYRGSDDEAIAEIREAIRLKPDYVNALVGLGTALKDLGKVEEAADAYREAIRIEPTSSYAHVGLGMTLRLQGKHDQAVSECREAKDPITRIGLALVLQAQSKLDEAVLAYREVIRLRPNFAGAHSNLGSALRQQGKVDEAIDECREAIRLKPNVPESHNALGRALADQKKLDEAIAEYREAIRLRPSYPEPRNDLGIALEVQGRRDDAIAEYREAIRLKPGYEWPHNNLGNLLRLQKKLEEAASEYREAIRLKPDFPEAHNGLGVVLSDQGKLEEGMAEYREAIRLKPDFALAHTNLGHRLRMQGDYAGSLAMLRKGHELSAKVPNWGRPSAKWVEEAARLVTIAARLPAILKGDDRPKDNADRLALGQMCYDTKRFAAAARFWDEALKADPKLGDDRQLQHGYNVACAAALAGAGPGKDEPPPDDSARAKLRGQALGWLKAELAMWTRFLESDPSHAKPAIIQTIGHWKADPDLAGIRDPDALTKLPDAEREAWKTFWADVEALLKRTQGPRP